MASSPTRKHFDLDHEWLMRCDTKKVGYPTKAIALDIAEQMMDRGDVKPGCHITPYQCGVCSECHVANRLIVF